LSSSVALIALIVRDYDEAMAWFTSSLGFSLREDTPLGEGKRWVVVCPPGGSGASLLLAKASTEEQKNCVGRQTGGRVFLFLHTSDFHADYERMKARGVRFLEEPRTEAYGIVAVFLDICGNKWDLVQPKKARGSE
jgi:catechol 2,3-dioxygenase-like lactoylglutathione lyase family enzyme